MQHNKCNFPYHLPFSNAPHSQTILCSMFSRGSQPDPTPKGPLARLVGSFPYQTVHTSTSYWHCVLADEYVVITLMHAVQNHYYCATLVSLKQLNLLATTLKSSVVPLSEHASYKQVHGLPLYANHHFNPLIFIFIIMLFLSWMFL